MSSNVEESADDAVGTGVLDAGVPGVGVLGSDGVSGG